MSFTATQPLLSRADLMHLTETFMPVGTIIRRGFDKSGYERKERLDGFVRCPRCGEDVGMWSDTDEWHLIETGSFNRWKHAGFGPGSGQCDCGQVLVENFDGVFALEI